MMILLRKAIRFGLMGALFFSCNKDDTSPDPQTGYFVKSLTLHEQEYNTQIDFRYDNNNRLIEQVFDTDTLRYAYNARGQLSDYAIDGQVYRFIYAMIWEWNIEYEEREL